MAGVERTIEGPVAVDTAVPDSALTREQIIARNLTVVEAHFHNETPEHVEKAIALYQKAQATRNFPSAGLAVTYAKMGRGEDAQHVLDQLLEKSRQQYVAADAIAAVYAAMEDKDEAFRWLDRAIDEHSAPMLGFIFNPEFRSLRSDPRFAVRVRRIGIDPSKVLSQQGNR